LLRKNLMIKILKFTSLNLMLHHNNIQPKNSRKHLLFHIQWKIQKISLFVCIFPRNTVFFTSLLKLDSYLSMKFQVVTKSKRLEFLTLVFSLVLLTEKLMVSISSINQVSLLVSMLNLTLLYLLSLTLVTIFKIVKN